VEVYEIWEELDLYNNISDFIYEADIVFTSARRTVYEGECIVNPAIVIVHNERKLKHHLTSSKFGFINLVLITTVSMDVLFITFFSLYNDFLKRKVMSEKNTKYRFKK